MYHFPALSPCFFFSQLFISFREGKIHYCSDVDYPTFLATLVKVCMYALLTKREVKVAEYWPNVFCVFLWTSASPQSIKTHTLSQEKTHTRPISSHLDQTSLVNKGFIIINFMAKRLHQRILLLWEQSGQSQAGKMDSQSEHRIHFILPTSGASHIIRSLKVGLLNALDSIVFVIDSLFLYDVKYLIYTVFPDQAKIYL